LHSSNLFQNVALAQHLQFYLNIVLRTRPVQSSPLSLLFDFLPICGRDTLKDGATAQKCRVFRHNEPVSASACCGLILDCWYLATPRVARYHMINYGGKLPA
jgi:hypothetical protein